MNATGAFVAGETSFFISPGMIKSSGEKVREALMPPQPAPKSATAASIASHKKFQLNLTCRV